MALSDHWRKSTRSAESSNCVQARYAPDTDQAAVEIGDTKHPDGPTLTVSAAEWAAFIADVCRSSRK